jgi:hypothetical protein
MNKDYIQNLRYKLQKRVRKLNSTTNTELFHFAVLQLWGFLQSQPIILGIMDSLEILRQKDDEDAKKIIEGSEGLVFDSEIVHVAVSYFVLKRCVQSDNRQVEIEVGLKYGTGKFEDAIEFFKDNFVETLYDYLDEQMDDQGMILSILKNFKHKCEWFRRDELLRQWESDTQKGEKALCLFLYEYLHDQGIQFSIEPSSASGEADLVSSQIGDERLVADAKIFNPDKGKGKPYIIKAFNQIYTYTLDYNEPAGYLVIFNTSGIDLKLALKEKTLSAPFILHNNKSIYFMIIDISKYEKPASQRGQLNSVEITEDEFVALRKESDIK